MCQDCFQWVKFAFQMFVREFQDPTETLAVKDSVVIWICNRFLSYIFYHFEKPKLFYCVQQLSPQQRCIVTLTTLSGKIEVLHWATPLQLTLGLYYINPLPHWPPSNNGCSWESASIFRLWFFLQQASEILATLTFLQERGRLALFVLLQLRVFPVLFLL